MPNPTPPRHRRTLPPAPQPQALEPTPLEPILEEETRNPAESQAALAHIPAATWRRFCIWVDAIDSYINGAGDGPDSYAGKIAREINCAVHELRAGVEPYLLPVNIVGRRERPPHLLAPSPKAES